MAASLEFADGFLISDGATEKSCNFERLAYLAERLVVKHFRIFGRGAEADGN